MRYALVWRVAAACVLTAAACDSPSRSLAADGSRANVAEVAEAAEVAELAEETMDGPGSLKRDGTLSRIALTEPVDHLAVAQAAGLLIVESDLTLWAIREKPLRERDWGAPVALGGDQLAGTALPIECDGGWSVVSGGRELLVLFEEKLHRIVFGDERPEMSEVELPDIDGEFYQARSSDDGRILLTDLALDVDPDFVAHQVALVDLEGSTVKNTDVISSLEDLHLGWSEAAAVFTIFDSSAGQLWRWHPETTEPQLLYTFADEGDDELLGFVARPHSAEVTLTVYDEERDVGALVSLPLDGVPPLKPTRKRLPPGRHTACVWHPTRPLLGCILEGDERDTLRVLDEGAMVKTEYALSVSIDPEALVWSSDGTRLYVLSDEGIAVWTPPAGLLDEDRAS
jgi:hypothetical protein